MDVGAQPVSRLRGLSLSEAAVRRLVLANAAALVADRRHGRHGSAHRVGARLRALARLHAAPLRAEERPQLHRVREPRDRVPDDPDDARDLDLRARPPDGSRRSIFFGTLAQAPLGALTVHYHLNPWWVLSHFLVSMVVLDLAVVLAAESRPREKSTLPRWVPRTACSSALAACVLLFSGTLATAAGPHPGSTVVRRLWSFEPAVYWHVRATAVFGISFALVLAYLVRVEGAAGPRRAGPARAARGADDDRRGAVPHAPAVVARARACDGRGDGVGGGRLRSSSVSGARVGWLDVESFASTRTRVSSGPC